MPHTSQTPHPWQTCFCKECAQLRKELKQRGAITTAVPSGNLHDMPKPKPKSKKK